jgi:pimeloyl-ACP methyl ester carboxylesterase
MTGMMVAAGGECNVKAVVVGDTMMTPGNFHRSLYAPLFRQLLGLLRLCTSQAELAGAMGKIVIPAPGFEDAVPIEELPGNTSELLHEWARCAFRTDPDAIAMTVDGTAFAEWAPENVLPQISCPTLLLQGNPELDGLLSDDDVKLTLRLLPKAQHVRSPLLGHALFMHQAKPVLDAVTGLLSNV